MNSKMTTNNYQQPNLKRQKQKQTKQTTRTGSEPQKWRSHGPSSVGKGGRRMKEKVQGIRSINGRYKIHRGRLRIVWEMEKSMNLYV